MDRVVVAAVGPSKGIVRCGGEHLDNVAHLDTVLETLLQADIALTHSDVVEYLLHMRLRHVGLVNECHMHVMHLRIRRSASAATQMNTPLDHSACNSASRGQTVRHHDAMDRYMDRRGSKLLSLSEPCDERYNDKNTRNHNKCDRLKELQKVLSERLKSKHSPRLSVWDSPSKESVKTTVKTVKTLRRVPIK